MTFPIILLLIIFYARLSGHYRDYLDAYFEGSFTSKEVEAKWDMLETIQSNIKYWEKHSTFDIENLFGTDSESFEVNNCCTISAIHVPFNDDMFTNEHTFKDSYSIAYNDYNDEYDISSSPTIKEKTRYDYNMPPIFDDYGDENNFVEFAPTTIVHVGSINSFMHMAHDKDVLCDSYIVNYFHDATEIYYERGKHGLMDLNNIEFPLFLLEFLKLHLFCLHMLVALCFYDLSFYKTIFHRKWFRFKFVSYLLFDALSCFKFFPAFM
jgi:hypothetical protein